MRIVAIESIVLKLFLASVVGLFLGLEREGKHKALGIKTCMIISITSCLLTIVSIDFAVSGYQGTFFTGSDHMRLASQIISGVGFLGAGVIFRRDDDVISGLTTAAIVWTAAGFGIAIASGYYLAVGISLLLVHLAVSFLPALMRKIGPRSLREQEIYLTIYISSKKPIDTIIEKIESFVIEIENVQIKRTNGSHQVEMRCFIEDDKGSIFSQYHKIGEIGGIDKIEMTKI